MAPKNLPPMKPAKATGVIREKAANAKLNVHLTEHAKEQMEVRDLIMGDVLHVLKHGFVFEEAEPATRPGFHKYRMDGVTPNSNGRQVRVVVIPSQACELKILTVMWVDERNMQRS